jgi:hemerythrin-like domain-containing protein
MAHSPAPESDAPLDQFSQCHSGILQHLGELGELPALLEPATRARRIASQTLDFFRAAVYEHHAEEERELFPAVLASAEEGQERDYVRGIVDRLTREHRQVEAAWVRLEPGLKDVARGRDSELNGVEVGSLVAVYRAHADYEEKVFLPLSQQILSRNGNHMAALGVSLHMRHVMPDVIGRFGHRI